MRQPELFQKKILQQMLQKKLLMTEMLQEHSRNSQIPRQKTAQRSSSLPVGLP